MKHVPMRIWTGLQILILLAVVIDIGLHVVWRPATRAQVSLAPVAIPMAFVSEHPECADELLRAMNVPNIRIQRYNGTLPGDEIMDDPIVAAWRAAQAKENRTHVSAATTKPGAGPGSPGRVSGPKPI